VERAAGQARHCFQDIPGPVPFLTVDSLLNTNRPVTIWKTLARTVEISSHGSADGDEQPTKSRGMLITSNFWIYGLFPPLKDKVPIIPAFAGLNVQV
jgi:hypothetical protein